MSTGATYDAQGAETAVIWGASGHASVVAEAARAAGSFRVIGLLDDVNTDRRGEIFAGLTVLGGCEQLTHLRASGTLHILLGVGENRARLRIADEAEAQGFQLGTVIHPSATVASSAVLEPGCVVVAGAVIGPEASVGRAAVVNTSASVDHHCKIGEGAHVGPGAALAGGVRIGRLAWVGIGAVVIEKITIGDAAFIGAGAVVLKDVPANTLAYGVPARSRPRSPTQ